MAKGGGLGGLSLAASLLCACNASDGTQFEPKAESPTETKLEVAPLEPKAESPMEAKLEVAPPTTETVLVTPAAAAESGSPAATTASASLMFSGRVNVVTGQVILPAAREVDARPASGGTAITLESFDAAGVPVQRAGASLMPDPPHVAPSDVHMFIAFLPKDPRARRLDVSFEGKTVKTLRVSGEPPRVEILYPRARARVPRERITMRWKGYGAPGAQLTYWVEYSHDGGESWTSLTAAHNRESLEYPAMELPGGHDCRLRVSVSDGLRTGRFSTGPFQIPVGPRAFEIVGPSRQVYALGDSIWLSVIAFDNEGREIDEDLVWSTERGGRIATGNNARVPAKRLGAGEHRITVSAEPPGHGRLEDSVTITVDPNLPRKAVPPLLNPYRR